MNRIERGLRAAEEAAAISTQNFRVGAAIYNGNRLISIGWNSRKTAPDVFSIFRWHHAETAALVGTNKVDLSRSTIYVVRLTKRNLRRMARPCKGCREALRAAGVRRAVFTNRNGFCNILKL